MCVYTVTAHEFSTFEAVTYLCALFLANATTDFVPIATLSNSEKTEQPVMMKTRRQFVETVCFGKIDFSLTLRAAKLSIPLADQCVFLQTVTAECMQAGYCLGIGKSIQTDCTSNLFFKVYQQRFHCERLLNSGTPFLVHWDSEKLEPFIASQNISLNTHRQPTRFRIIYPLTLEAEVKEGFSPHCFAGNIDIKTKDKYKILLQKCVFLMDFFLHITLRVEKL